MGPQERWPSRPDPGPRLSHPPSSAPTRPGLVRAGAGAAFGGRPSRGWGHGSQEHLALVSAPLLCDLDQSLDFSGAICTTKKMMEAPAGSWQLCPVNLSFFPIFSWPCFSNSSCFRETPWIPLSGLCSSPRCSSSLEPPSLTRCNAFS